MWKVLLADDEFLIVRGLRRLINWQALGTQVVGEATDGAMAARMIEQLRPDLVVSDIRMPELTGLELMERFQGREYAPKFIFISGYEEFEYVRQALSGGAVDYLLKPVSAQALEKAVRKALGRMETSSAAALLRQPMGTLQDFFHQFAGRQEFADSELSKKFSVLLDGREDVLFFGVCLGLPPEEEKKLEELPTERMLLRRFMIFNAARDYMERSGQGCFLRKDDTRCWLMAFYSPDENVELAMRGMLDAVAAKTGAHLRAGVGKGRQIGAEMADSCQEAGRAFDLFYFEGKDLICYPGEGSAAPMDNEAIQRDVQEIFQAIVSKSDQVLDWLDTALNHVAAFHWGNRNAALNRVMIVTGDLCQMLFANRLLTGSFAQYQDQLQHTLEACPTFEDLRTCLKDYYQRLLPDIYRTARSKSSQEIYRVQRYIQEHYDQDLSLKALAEVACVSPHYFSAYFKAETGQNYKAYLTQVRMEHAMRLVMGTDLKAYEIAEQVGYNNVRRFVDAFRAAYQMSPTDYRKLHRR